MNSIESFEDLIELGPSRVHEQTHISRDKLVLLFSKSYGKINKVQLMGYLSILEREYKLNLSDIKNEYLEYMDEHKDAPVKSTYTLLQPRRKSFIKRLILWLFAIALVFFIAMRWSEFSNETVSVVETEILEDVNSSSYMQNDEDVVVAEPIAVEPKPIEKPAKSLENRVIITPKMNLWYGAKDLDSNTTKEFTTTKPIELDSSKRWLVILGHGNIDISDSDSNRSLEEKSSQYMLCSDGKLSKITYSKYIELNGGKKWGE